MSLDYLFLRRACELAARGRGSTAPNPVVGAVIVRDARVLGEGFHRRRGEAHAEVEALRAAAGRARGATLYVTLEPCDHQGLTPPCTRAILDAGISRVVVGALDPNPRTAQGGVRRLREHGVAVDIVDEPCARMLIEDFTVAVTRARPFVTLKLAASIDGYVAPRPGRHWLTGERALEFVRELRAAHDAVMVGAGTVRIDDPRLTIRPPRARARPYVRVVACEEAPVPPESRIFQLPEPSREGVYAPTIVLAPAGSRPAFAPLEGLAEVLYVGDADARSLDVQAALAALRARGICSVLSEGGPTLASRLLAGGLVDRLRWIVAPKLLANVSALPALARVSDIRLQHGLTIDSVTRLGDDVLLSARFEELPEQHV